jgi:predicted ester cyclase
MTTDAAGPPADSALALVRRLIDEVWNGGQLDVLRELYADPFEHDGEHGTVDDLVAWHERDTATWADTSYEVLREVSDGESVAVRWRVTCRQIGQWGPVPPTGRTVTRHGAHFFRIADGRIVGMASLADALGAAVELGVEFIPPGAEPTT